MVAIDEMQIPPFRQVYFSDEMVMKYEPLATAIRKLKESDGKDKDALEQYELHLEKYKTFEWCDTGDGSKHDIVFYGVSGYTGYLMMEYLKRVALKRNPEEFTFAFAGRTPSKVQALRDRLFAGTKWEDVPVLQMSYDDPFSVINLVRSSRVIINVAGPYMLTQGELLIDCCVSMGVDYIDISGEIPWSRRVMDLDKHARENGTYVIPSAATAGGFPDMGTFLLAKKMREEYNEELRKVICYATGGGTEATASGGTLKTRAAMASGGDEARKMMGDPFSLGGYVPDRDRNGIKVCNIEFGTGKVNTKVRGEDLDANISKITEDKHLGVWRGPHVYSYFDTRIVRRSNMLFADLGNCPYGRNLNYMQYAILPTDQVKAQKGAGGGAGGAAGAGSGGGGGGGAGGAGAGVDAERAALEAKGLYYKPGEGPALEELEDAWVGFLLWAQSPSGQELKCSIIGRDGYFETCRVAIETAMCLCFDRPNLPFKGGMLTPTVACQTFLAKRMMDSGIKFKMGEWHTEDERTPPPNPA
eukprot:TRINITY_DN20776_c0_g1_i1.p1 TRINITY_DN20776_c0_g1~~TRINITY_DN20776_c0_g1_i1.p1  ORF type:complete len:552 (-),score=152.43 TRINITY_DN20776_c0_g1_i1:313-1899(-)